MSGRIEVDVLCLGHACMDLAFSVPHHPTADEKMSATALQVSGGGPAANAAVAVARLGGSAAFCGYLGGDAFGDRHLAELEEEGVKTELVVRGTAPTVIAAVIVKPGGDRSVINFSSDTPKLSAHAVDFADIRPRVMLVDGHEPELGLAAVEAGLVRGIPTVLDAGSLHRGTELLAPRVDYVVASEKFARQSANGAEREAALREIFARYRRTVVTLGECGLAWWVDGAGDRLAAFPIDPVDTNGAGDAFHGAFALGLARRMEWPELLAYASAVGALTCTKTGARPALPSAAEVRAFQARPSQGRRL